MLTKVLLEVVYRFPPFGQDNTLTIERVGCHDVFEAALLLSRGAHSLNTRLDESIPLFGVNGEHSLHNDYGHTPL